LLVFNPSKIYKELFTSTKTTWLDAVRVMPTEAAKIDKIAIFIYLSF
jgi:hypothetical protein